MHNLQAGPNSLVEISILIQIAITTSDLSTWLILLLNLLFFAILPNSATAQAFLDNFAYDPINYSLSNLLNCVCCLASWVTARTDVIVEVAERWQQRWLTVLPKNVHVLWWIF